MSRTGLYWTDDQDRLCCSHGVILYGSKCLRCERGDIIDPNLRDFDTSQRFHSGGVIGVDLASGPDRTATGTYQRVGETMRFTVDDLKNEYVVSAKVAEAMARRAMNGDRARMDAMHERINEGLRKRWEHMRGDPRPRESHWGGPPRSRVPEIITDPLDQRGVNARRVGPGR